MISLICIIIIAVVFYCFNNVLGTRTGSERTSFDHHANDQNASQDHLIKNEEDLILEGQEETLSKESHFKAIDRLAGKNDILKANLYDIAKKDENFNILDFEKGARRAYEVILTAFARGDKETLKPLLDDFVYADFAKAIDDREALGENIDFTFVGIDQFKIIDASLENDEARIAINFKSEIISATYDSQKTLIEGDLGNLTFIEDSWIFSRNIGAETLNWKLISTEGEV